MVENMMLLLIGLMALCAFFVIGEIAAKYFDWE